MKIIVCKNYDEMSAKAAEIIREQVNGKPDSVLGFATGSTPIGMYRCLIDMYNNNKIDFKDVTSFNLDEYYPISNDDEQSYHYFMRENLFNHINLNPSKIHIPNGEAKNASDECAAYENAIAASGGIDIQILGIGRNGHIGFNEPDVRLNTKTHMTPLTEDTIKANARFFESENSVPKHALTMGISTILGSKKILLLANGHSKHNAVRELLSDGITTDNPATMLKVHPDVTIICDYDAYSEVKLGIDIGGMSAKIGVVEDNAIIERKTIPITEKSTANSITNSLCETCIELMQKYPVQNIGIGTPGIISNGKITAANLPFTDFNLGQAMSDKLNIPVKIGNDANCAALGEYLAGAANEDNANNIVLITLGTGIGAGIIINGQIYSGRDSAGEVGHMIINNNGLPCQCGEKGCWEQYASVSALIKQTHAAVLKNPNSLLAECAQKSLSGRTVFEAVDNGCPIAEEVLEQYLDYLVLGLKNIISIFDPEVILISGGLSNEGERLTAPIQAKLESRCKIKTASLKNDAGIIGAAAL